MSPEAPPPATPVITVLLVDDQRIIGEAVRRLLADQPDIKFCYCADPEQALDRANEIQPSVILQDLVMPKIDGLAVVRLFRGNPGTATTPIIVLSGSEDAESRAQALAAGANDYLVKLPNKSDLLARIRAHLR
ncbi:MAG: adenylate cyclase [Chthoniobacter sp.]|jgi:PleD family two-component response regulator|nr:adenylate cyclase [Chthoniobacter sp.]